MLVSSAKNYHLDSASSYQCDEFPCKCMWSEGTLILNVDDAMVVEANPVLCFKKVLPPFFFITDLMHDQLCKPFQNFTTNLAS